jgi:hypothetical protein
VVEDALAEEGRRGGRTPARLVEEGAVEEDAVLRLSCARCRACTLLGDLPVLHNDESVAELVARVSLR